MSSFELLNVAGYQLLLNVAGCESLSPRPYQLRIPSSTLFSGQVPSETSSLVPAASVELLNVADYEPTAQRCS